MIRISITIEAYEAIVATFLLGTVAYEPEPNAKGERLIWVEEIWCSKLDAIRKPRRQLQRRRSAARRTGAKRQ